MFVLDHMMKRFFRRNKKKDAGSSFVEPVHGYPTVAPQCEPPQEYAGSSQIIWKHSWSSAETQNALSTSAFSAIPTEIILRIFRLLSVPDLCRVSLVCRSFKMVVDQDEIWKLKCNSKFFSFNFIHGKSQFLKLWNSIGKIIFEIIQTDLHGLGTWEKFTKFRTIISTKHVCNTFENSLCHMSTSKTSSPANNYAAIQICWWIQATPKCKTRNVR